MFTMYLVGTATSPGPQTWVTGRGIPVGPATG
jgi:hypothetical protein